MTREKSVKYQNEKIQYYKTMVGYYQDMIKNSGSARLTDDEINDQVAYHKRLAAYHKQRRDLLLRGA